MFAPLFRFEASDHYMKKKTLTAYPGYAFSACSAPYFINCYETQKSIISSPEPRRLMRVLFNNFTQTRYKAELGEENSDLFK